MFDILKNPKYASKKIDLYKMGSGSMSHAKEIWYSISIEKIPLGVGEKIELMDILLRNLSTISCLVCLGSRLK